MKQRFFFRIMCGWMLLAALPALSRTGENRFVAGASAIADSVPLPQQDDKAKKKEKDPKKNQGDAKDQSADKGKDVPEDPKTETDVKRPVVKEVPKARPKLRPAAVTDKIKIKKPPIKVKGLIRSMGI